MHRSTERTKNYQTERKIVLSSVVLIADLHTEVKMSAKSQSSIHALVDDEKQSHNFLLIGVTVLSFLLWCLNVFFNAASTLLVSS